GTGASRHRARGTGTLRHRRRSGGQQRVARPRAGAGRRAVGARDGALHRQRRDDRRRLALPAAARLPGLPRPRRLRTARGMTVVTLYGKPGCHLCEDAFQAIERVRREREFDLREVDVTLDPGLNREYGERIPVVAVDGVERFEFFVDAAALTRALDRVEP